MIPFFAAWQFLTIFPTPRFVKIKTEDLEHSVLFFPLVGLLLGLGLAGLDTVLRSFFPQGVASVLLVISLISFSGGFHADGLADTADGFLSSRPRERILEIMKDSRSGPMAVIVLISVFAVKWAVLSELAGPRFWKLILVPLLSRWNLLLSMNLNSYARSNDGLAKIFTQKDSKPGLVMSGFLILFFIILAMGIPGVTIFFVSTSFAFLFSFYCRSKIGGFTGDTLGAVCELTEAVVLLAALFTDRILI